jgi:GT2 family glycosyltransferase
LIIPSYEAKGHLIKCLESIEPYLEVSNFELIIIDNASSKNVIDVLSEYKTRHHEKIKITFLDQNFGFTHAVNLGISQASKENDVVLLNNDAVLIADCLFKLQETAYKSDLYGIAVPAQVLPGGTDTIVTHVPYALPEFEIDVNVSAHHQNLISPPLYHNGGPLEISFAPFFCVLIKSSTRTLAPKLDELNGRHYRSDRTYCSYVTNVLGLRVIYEPEAKIYHSLQASTKDLSKKKSDSDVYNKIFINNAWSEDEVESLGLKINKWNSIF